MRAGEISLLMVALAALCGLVLAFGIVFEAARPGL